MLQACFLTVIRVTRYMVSQQWQIFLFFRGEGANQSKGFLQNKKFRRTFGKYVPLNPPVRKARETKWTKL